MAIEITVKSNGMQVNERLDDYIRGKASKLERYINALELVRIELTHAKTAKLVTDRYVAQITLHGKKVLLRAEERSEDIYVAFDAAMDKIQRRIERFKGKRYRSRGDGLSIGEAALEIAQAEIVDEMIEEEEPVIARRKKFVPWNR